MVPTQRSKPRALTAPAANPCTALGDLHLGTGLAVTVPLPSLPPLLSHPAQLIRIPALSRSTTK